MGGEWKCPTTGKPGTMSKFTQGPKALIACLGGANGLGFGTLVGGGGLGLGLGLGPGCALEGLGLAVMCGLGYVGHVEQVYLRRQGPNRLSWGCKRVRVWHSSRGLWAFRAWARAWSRLCP
jgi:hypothetical protein